MSYRILSLAVAATIAAASQASAQTPAQPAQPNPNAQALQAAQANPTGPVVPGMCVVNRDEVIGTSTVGRYAAQRLQQIEAQANAELTTARTTAETNMRALEGQRATLGDQAFVTQANALNQQFEALVNTRVREIQATNAVAEQRILAEMTPVIVESFRAKNCSILLDGSIVVMRADAMDISKDVVARLNSKVTQFPLERVQAPAQPAAGAAAPAAAPAVGPRR